jgi:hypothetical protein
VLVFLTFSFIKTQFVFLLLELLFVQVDQSKNRNLSRLSNMNSTFTYRELSYFGNLQVNYLL